MTPARRVFEIAFRDLRICRRDHAPDPMPYIEAQLFIACIAWYEGKSPARAECDRRRMVRALTIATGA